MSYCTRYLSWTLLLHVLSRVMAEKDDSFEEKPVRRWSCKRSCTRLWIRWRSGARCFTPNDGLFQPDSLPEDFAGNANQDALEVTNQWSKFNKTPTAVLPGSKSLAAGRGRNSGLGHHHGGGHFVAVWKLREFMLIC